MADTNGQIEGLKEALYIIATTVGQLAGDCFGDVGVVLRSAQRDAEDAINKRIQELEREASNGD